MSSLRVYFHPHSQESLERFFSKIDTRGPMDCWNWVATKNQKGYGRIKVDKMWYSAHRFLWQLVNGPIPRGLLVCHSCDNPSCCNPNHLWLGTHQENMDDMVEKGRSIKGRIFLEEEIKKRNSTRPRGNKHHLFGKHHSEETCKKISDARAGKKHTEEFCKDRSEAYKGSGNPRAKYTEAQANDIRAYYSQGCRIIDISVFMRLDRLSVGRIARGQQ